MYSESMCVCVYIFSEFHHQPSVLLLIQALTVVKTEEETNQTN